MSSRCAFSPAASRSRRPAGRCSPAWTRASSPASRRAPPSSHVVLRLGLEAAGNTLQRGQINDAPDDGGEAFAEVIVRSGRERFSAAVVRELFLRLQEAQVSRLIARLKLAGEAEKDGQGGKLARLYAVRHRLRDAIRARRPWTTTSPTKSRKTL